MFLFWLDELFTEKDQAFGEGKNENICDEKRRNVSGEIDQIL